VSVYSIYKILFKPLKFSNLSSLSRMSSLRNQESVVADAARVLLYQNYVMYDRWMSYRRFNAYYQDNDHWETDEDERQYYNKNVLNFLVLKFNRKENGSIGNYDVILLDTNFKNIYNLGDPIHIAHANINDYQNNFYDRRFPIVNIFECRPPRIDCLGIAEDGRWCDNLHSNTNGYCNEHQHQSHEFEDVDVDRLLTLGELMNLPEFQSLHNLPLHADMNYRDNEDNDDNNNDDDDFDENNDDYDDDDNNDEYDL